MFGECTLTTSAATMSPGTSFATRLSFVDSNDTYVVSSLLVTLYCSMPKSASSSVADSSRTMGRDGGSTKDQVPAGAGAFHFQVKPAGAGAAAFHEDVSIVRLRK